MPDDSRTPLPRRVPGAADGPKPPRRVLPPALAQDVLDRLRAEADSADGPNGPGSDGPGQDGSAQAERLVPVPRPSRPAPAMTPAANGGPRPGPGSPLRSAATKPVPVRPERDSPPPMLATANAPDRPAAAQQSARRRSWGGRGYAIAAAVVAIGIAGSLAFVVARGSAGRTGPGPGRSASADTPFRGLAASWVAAQVSHTAVVSCDPAMCQLLATRGVPAADLLALRPGSSPLGSQVIVATATVRGWLGSRLSTVYAPEVLAAFGSGEQRIDVRVIAPDGPAAYLIALTADLQARRLAGRQLLASPRIGARAPAGRQLASGRVDPRLIVTIADLASLEPVYIVSFGGSAPGASPGVPLRSANLAETGQTPRLRAYYAQTFMSFLRGPAAPYRAGRIESVRLPGGQAILRIEFAAPTPLGLVGPTG
jgi:hypothetical protein